MQPLTPLVHLRWFLWKGALRSLRQMSLAKVLAIGISGLFFLGLETYFFDKIFHFLFHKVDPSLHVLSRALSLHLLQLVFLVFAVMLVYSNLVTSISVYLASSDMKVLLVWPIRPSALYLHKFLETLIRSSLMLALFVLPALVTYGAARDASWEYYLLLPGLICLFLIIPCAVAVPVMLALARIFPTKRLQQGLIAAGLVATTAGLFAFRMLRVEEVLLQAGTTEQLLAWGSSFRLPDWSWMPSSWLVHAVASMLDGDGQPMRWILQLTGAAGGLLMLSCITGAPLLHATWSRAFGVPRRSLQTRRWSRFGMVQAPGLSRGDSAMILKEIKVFGRDLSRWSQIVMMIPLIGFYLLNMHLLPFRDQFREVYYLLNLFMIAFIQAAIGARYLFPSISWEGPALWLVRVSPYPVWRLVAIKFAFLSLPLLLLTLALTGLSFQILDFGADFLAVSLGMAMATTILLSGLAVGFGAMLPKFRYEHHLEISLGPGGILYMLTALAFSFAYVALLAAPAVAAMGDHIWDWGYWNFSVLTPPPPALRNLWFAVCAVGTASSLLAGVYSLSCREVFDR